MVKTLVAFWYNVMINYVCVKDPAISLHCTKHYVYCNYFSVSVDWRVEGNEGSILWVKLQDVHWLSCSRNVIFKNRTRIWVMSKRACKYELSRQPAPSALRLLTATYRRVWQRNAFCPLSLWPLVSELHPLNWARAQTVRLISDKVTVTKSFKNNLCVWTLLQTR